MMEQSNQDKAKEAGTGKSSWKVADSAALYGIHEWGTGFFDVSKDGNVVIRAPFGRKSVSVPLIDIINGMKERDIDMPSVLRVENLLDSRITQLNAAFAKAIQQANYQGEYRGVFPIKVNQQCHVIEEIARFGSRYHHGFEAGSKAEMIIALSELQDLDSLIICNGYKDAEFIELGLFARQMGVRCFFVLESVSELDIILDRSKALGIEPLIGVRIKLSAHVEGHWSKDNGERSIFGLSTNSLLRVVGKLRDAGKLDCLQLLHCHLGSQIPNIRNIRTGVREACRFYAGLIEEGAPLGYLDLGGGLAVDYEGSRTNSIHSMNYELDEYCADIVEAINENLTPMEIPHPVIVTESGRATVAHSSMLLFNILETRTQGHVQIPDPLPANCNETVYNLYETLNSLSARNVQESYNDALHYRNEVRNQFLYGHASLGDRALAENLCLAILGRIREMLPNLDRIPTDLENLSEILSDIYYGNFSLFQSLPDIWAIDQVFPVMPIHRLDEEPDREAIFADITCDIDGKIDRFANPEGIRTTCPVHQLRSNEEYYLGIFLVGAYQETLGDLHNLFGDTNVVSVRINEDASFEFVHEFQGDSIADVLTYVEYDPTKILEQLRRSAEKAVRDGRINVAMRRQMLKAYRESLQGYTYFER